MPADNALPLHRKPELRAPVVSQPVDQILGHSLLRTLQVRLRHGDEAQTSPQGRGLPSASPITSRTSSGPSRALRPVLTAVVLPPPVGEAPHVEEREEEDLLLCHVSRHCNSVHAVVRLRPGQEDSRGDQTGEERSVCGPLPPSSPASNPFTLYHTPQSPESHQVFFCSPAVFFFFPFKW